MLALEIFVWTFGGILFTLRINSRLILGMNFFNKKWNESLRHLLKDITYKKRHGILFHIYGLNRYSKGNALDFNFQEGLLVQAFSGSVFLKLFSSFLQF